LGTYTSRFNRRHKLVGHLFSGRYKALIVDGNGNGYPRAVCDYLHLNPVRANLLTAEGRLRAYRLSSYPEYLKPPNRRPQWLRVDRLFGEMRILKDSVAGRQQFGRLMEQRRQAQDPKQWKALRRGWCFGAEQFRAELLEQMRARMGTLDGGAERSESAEARARRILNKELKRRGWVAAKLQNLAKRDAEKIKIAGRLRRETTMTWSWIAAHLHMGAVGYAAQCLRQR